MTPDKTLEELAEKFAAEWYPSALDQAARGFMVEPLVKFAAIANASQQRELAEYREAAKVAASETCGDEKHCTCVPLLRAEVDRLSDGLNATIAAYDATRDQLRTERERVKAIVERLKDRAVFNCDAMEGADPEEFKWYETAMIDAIESLETYGVKFDPITGKESALSTPPELKSKEDK